MQMVESRHAESLQRQLARATHRAESFRRLIESISSELSLDRVLARVVESAVELLDAEHGAVGLVVQSADGPAVRTAAVYNLPFRREADDIPSGVGLWGRVLQERQPIRLDRYDDLDRRVRTDIAEHAMMCVPIWWASRMIGVLGIGALPPRRFTEEDVEALGSLARNAAVAIENARLFELERRRGARITTINRIGRLLTSKLGLDELLETAIKALAANLEYHNIALMLVDAEDPETLVLHTRGGVYADSNLGRYRQSIHAGIAGAAARARRPLLVNDVRKDPRYIPVSAGANLRAELAIPLVVSDRLVGLLNIESEQPVDEEDAADFAIIADQLAIAIDNAHRFEAEQRRAARMATVNRIARLLTSSLSLDEILQRATESIYEHLGYEYVGLMLADPDDPAMLVLRARSGRYGVGPGDYRQSIETGVIGAVARDRRRILLADVSQDARYLPLSGPNQIRAELAVPIVLGDELLGVLNIESEHLISEEDAVQIEVIADQLGVAVENARLFAQTQAALEEARLLYETSRRIGAAGDVNDVIHAYLDQVATHGEYVCTVILYERNDDGERDAVTVRGRWSPWQGISTEIERLPYSYDDLDPPLDAGQTVLLRNVHTDPRVSPMLREIQTRSGRPALAMIPLMVRDERIGLVILSWPAVHDWTDAELHPYKVTAAQLATAIDSRRQQLLLMERGQQLAVLEERGRLARELHDSVTQLVFSVTLVAQTLAAAWRRDPAEGERRVNRLLQSSQAALAELRALLAELRP
ncbi:MAG: GAF domain-containing protein, partial [Dehalococcoidia bacterium]